MRTTWTDELLESTLRPICESMGCFPSAQDLRAIGHDDLNCQIQRRGGFITWADRLGFSRKWSDSDTGWLGESKFAELAQANGYRVTKRAGVKAPYDLIVNDVVRVDVKSARLATYRAFTGWYWRIGKHVQSDLVVLFQLDTANFFALPWWECNASNITVGHRSNRLADYLNAWSLIDRMIAARIAERN